MASIKKLICNKEKFDVDLMWEIRNWIEMESSAFIRKMRKKIKEIRYNRIMYRNNCFIPLTCKIGEGVVFPHGLYGIFISQGAVIGDNCTIFHQVTIGSNALKDSKSYGAPTIGSNVYIGAGAKVIGNVHIGDHVRIGAGAIVTKDVPENFTVVMPMPIIYPHDVVKDNKFEAYHSESQEGCPPR